MIRYISLVFDVTYRIKYKNMYSINKFPSTKTRIIGPRRNDFLSLFRDLIVQSCLFTS